jgi:alpha-mannosidase
MRQITRPMPALRSQSASDPSELTCGRSARFITKYYVPITPAEQKETASLVLRNAGRTLKTSLEVRPIRHWQVYVVHNSHQDPGFLDLPSKLRARFVPFIDKAMNYCEETSPWPADSQFKWNIDVSYLVEDYLKARGPEKLREAMDWVKKGRMTMGGL